MDNETILGEVSEDLFGYLMAGQLTRDKLTAAIRPSSLDSRYDEFDALVDLHFVLSEPVISFVEHLPERLRELKTETTATRRETRGEINGRIDWSETYQQRFTRGNVEQSLYIYSERQESRDTPQNRLLRYVVEVIADALTTAEPYFQSNTRWLAESWDGDADLRRQFLRLYETNIHLQAIDVPTPTAITHRMVRQAETARQPLYRQAARLYHHHTARRTGDEAFLRQLIADTTILPEDEARRFELYVLCKTIRAMSTLAEEDGFEDLIGSYALHALTPGRSGPAATFDGQKGFNLYYDQSGEDLGLSFRINPEVPPEEFSRGDAATVYGERAAAALYGNKHSAHTKRPDVLIAPQYPGLDPTADYLVMEVKHSTNESTIRQGIQELTRYLAFLRRDGESVFADRGYQGSGINGVLVVKDVGDDILGLNQQANLPITVLQASELTSDLPNLLKELFSRGSSSRYS